MATTLHVTTSPAAILSAIATHRHAWEAFQAAPDEGADFDTAEEAETAMNDALAALLGTPCGTHFGCVALLMHLRWWLLEEADFAADYQPHYGQAVARAADLSLSIGERTAKVPALSRYGVTASVHPADEAPPCSPEPWQLVMPVRPDTPHVRALRALDAVGEAFAALVLIAGGAVATGLATLL